MRCKIGILLLAMALLMAGHETAGAQGKAEAKAPPGPATKMKITLFVTLQTQGILKIQFQAQYCLKTYQK